MQNLEVATIQTTLHWEDPARNLGHFSEKIHSIDKPVDLILLPEMFTSGFTKHPQGVAEPMHGPSMQWMHRHAAERQCVVAGSLVIEDQGRYYNRFVWMRPDGSCSHYDKKHLFSHAGEDENYVAGHSRVIVELKGWKVMLQVCYDIRFPVFSRNRYHADTGFDYDLLIYTANWPAARSHAWRVLLMARAIENMCYVVGVNRIGTDERDIAYTGDSAAVDSYGETLVGELPGMEHISVFTLPRCPLDSHREKFRVWKDWD